MSEAAKLLLGIDIGGTKLHAVVADETGRVEARARKKALEIRMKTAQKRIKVKKTLNDGRIEEAAGLKLPEIFALHSEAYYRRLTLQCLRALLETGRPCVVALPGGVLHDEEHGPIETLIYVTVPDLTKALKQAESLGGKAIVSPTTVLGSKRIAQFEDPEGNVVGLVQG